MTGVVPVNKFTIVKNNPHADSVVEVNDMGSVPHFIKKCSTGYRLPLGFT